VAATVLFLLGKLETLGQIDIEDLKNIGKRAKEKKRITGLIDK